MSTKMMWAIVAFVVLAGVGYYLYANSGNKGSNLPGATEETPGGATETSGSATVGVWQSAEDPKFTREFKADGAVIDRYEGDASATATGTWAEVNAALEGEESIGVPLDVIAGKTVLKLTFTEGEPMYFGVNSLTENSLSLTYYGRGNILTFTKVD